MSNPRFVIDTEYTRHALTESWRVLYRKKFLFFKIVGAALFICSAFSVLAALTGTFQLSFSSFLLLVLICATGAVCALFPQYLMLAINRKKLSKHLGSRHIELYEDGLYSTGTDGKVTHMPWVLLKSFAESREYFFLDFGTFFSILSKEGLDEPALQELRSLVKEQLPHHSRFSFKKQ